MKKYLFISTLVALFASACAPTEQPTSTDITADDIRTHITFLASDTLMGRRGGSEYELIAANYLADQFTRFGLKPAGSDGSYLQPFPITLGVRLAPGNSLAVSDQTWSPADSSIYPWANSSSGQADSRLVFAGYGISAPDLNYDDYANLDVEGAIVLILRYGPDGANNPHSEYGAYWPIRDKVKLAAEKGAVAVLLSSAPGDTLEDVILPLDRERMMAESEIPVLQIHPDVATAILATASVNLQESVSSIATAKQSASQATELTVSMSVALEADKQDSRNVIALLEGTDPDAGMIVIGAHYDHLGMGESGSLFRGPEPRIHNGADDNASGTAGMLELAEYFAANPSKHDILFMGFGSEEMGLLGSEYFVNNPTISLENVRAMINMDMIGRMVDKKLLIFGIGSSPDWESILTSANTDSLELKLVPDGTGASDHTSFYNKGIPVLHYFTDTHSDYHRPSDDTDFIRFDEQVMVLGHVQRVVTAIDALPADQLAYTTAPVTQTRNMTIGNVTLGVLPDYGYDGPGMKITGTTEGRPGAKAGLVAGDIIIKIGDIDVKDIYDYMESLNKFNPGDKTTIIVKRNDTDITLPVQL